MTNGSHALAERFNQGIVVFGRDGSPPCKAALPSLEMREGIQASKDDDLADIGEKPISEFFCTLLHDELC